jgi:anti-sigma-K factor RskA
MAETNHDAMHELTGLYVLGALDQAERRAFETHLASCAACTAEVRTLGGVARALPYAVPQVDPPAGLRDRVLGSAQARSFEPAFARQPDTGRTFNFGWLAAAALLAVAVGLGAYAVTLRERIGGLELQLAEAVTRLNRSEQQVAVAVRSTEAAEARLAVLTSPDLLQVDLSGLKPAPQARGRAFLSRSRGLLFSANALPPLPAGRIYQLWYLTKTTPVSAGLLQPDAGGQIVTAFQAPADTLLPTGFAVSIEPAGGVPQPTGDLYLAGMTD